MTTLSERAKGWAKTYGWSRVSFAGECLGGDDTGPGDECSLCHGIYWGDCRCPGPSQEDDYEYGIREGVLFARLSDPEANRHRLEQWPEGLNDSILDLPI